MSRIMRRDGRGGFRGNRGNKKDGKDATPWKLRQVAVKAENSADPQRDDIRKVAYEFVQKVWVRYLNGDNDVKRFVNRFREADYIDGDEPLKERLDAAKTANFADIELKNFLGIKPESPIGWLLEGQVKYTTVIMEGFSAQDLNVINNMLSEAREKVQTFGKEVEDQEETLPMEELTALAQMASVGDKVDLVNTPAVAKTLDKLRRENQTRFDEIVRQYKVLSQVDTRGGGEAFNQAFNVNRITALASFLIKVRELGTTDYDFDQTVILCKSACSLGKGVEILKRIQTIFGISDERMEKVMVQGKPDELHFSTTMMTPGRLSECLCQIVSMPAVPGSFNILENQAEALVLTMEAYQIERDAQVTLKKSVNALIRTMADAFDSRPGKNVSRNNKDMTSTMFKIQKGGVRRIILEEGVQKAATEVIQAGGQEGEGPLANAILD